MKLNDTHESANDQKLFEVEVHSLEVAEKRELEEILYSFVRSLMYRREELEPGDMGCECTRSNLSNHKRISSQPAPPRNC